jgi:hypothetical protein
MKTAMQEYINDTLNGETDTLNYYLEKEQHQIMLAYEEGRSDGFFDYKKAEQYYNETFTKL